jgi:preprotein translocase subunit SecD
MIRITRWKVAVVVAATLLGLLFTLPNFLSPSIRDKLPGWVPHSTLNLGLDLQGGSYLLYEVDTPSLIKDRLNNLAEDARRTLREAHIDTVGLATDPRDVTVTLKDPATLDAAYTAMSKLTGAIKQGGGTTPEFTLDRLAPQSLRMTLRDQAIAAETIMAVDQSIGVINRRINGTGTKEPNITRQGSNRIVIEAAGESNPERLKTLIGQTAKLTFQMVDETASVEAAQKGDIPAGDELLPYANTKGSIVVSKDVPVTGDMLTNAQVQGDSRNGGWAVELTFNGQGANRFGSLTTENVGKRFAIVLDNKVLSAPTIQSAILGGDGQITGDFNVERASELALLLKSGSLPVKLDVVAQSTVGSSLGQEAIEKGTTSLIVGAVAIFAFIILAYGLFGVFAAIALLINALLIMGLLSITQSTLTLPGIAGIVLTLAVAVDANVLVYERMRDEARAGHAAMMSADQGYRRALVSIFDANVTTLIAAIIMYAFGSGAVKGFALTLGMGVVTSVFTAILVTQVLIGWWFKLARPKQLPI